MPLDCFLMGHPVLIFEEVNDLVFSVYGPASFGISNDGLVVQ